MAELDVKTFSQLLKKKRLLQKYGLRKITLFGSFVRGGAFKDIDILVDNVSDYDALIEFKNELETLTERRVDIVIKKFANPIILYRAQKDMVDVSLN